MRIADFRLRDTRLFYREGAKSARKSPNSGLGSFKKPLRLLRPSGSGVFVIVCFLSSIFFFLSPAPSFAEDLVSTSGRLSVRGVEELREDSVPEDPGVAARIKFDAAASSWRFHSWLEGGWDGAVTRPSQDNSLF